MRLDEIIRIDRTSQTFDNLKNGSAKSIYKLFEYVKDTSEDFTVDARTAFGNDEIEDFIFELTEFSKVSPFLPTDQVTQIVEKLFLYFRE